MKLMGQDITAKGMEEVQASYYLTYCQQKKRYFRTYDDK